MIAAISRLICRWRGHRWSHPRTVSVGVRDGITMRIKHCRLCGATAPVKARKARAKKEAA